MDKRDNKVLHLFIRRLYIFISNMDFEYVPKELQDQSIALYHAFLEYFKD